MDWAIIGAVLTLATFLSYWHVSTNRKLDHIERKIENMPTLDDFNAAADRIDASFASSEASHAGITADIQALKDQIAAGGMSTADEEAALARVAALEARAATLATGLADTDAQQ